MIELRTEDDETTLPYSVTVGWNEKTPNASEGVALNLQTRLLQPTVTVNETVRMEVLLTNGTAERLPMSIVRLGIPAGLSLQAWQLRELQEGLAFDYYEIFEEDLVLYFTSLAPSEERRVLLDLKAEVPGDYLGRANSAYLYYEDELKYWTTGLACKVVE